MDRRFAYIGAIPQDLDILKTQRNTLIALGYETQGWMGTGTYVDGLSCTPTTPTSLAVNIGPGQVFTQAPVDVNAFGSLASDNTHQIIKQGVLLDTVQLTLTPPSTAGQAVNFLVQVQLLEQDIDVAALPYFNPASLTNPNAVAWSGPSNSGVAQPLTRQSTVQVSLKAGVAATAGSQVTPAADSGYTGLYAITVAQGATQITGSNIAPLSNAPFILLKLPNVPGWVQSGTYAWGVDAGTANAVIANLNPVPTAYTAGMRIVIKKMASANTGGMTVNLNGLGVVSLLDQTGSALASGALPGGDAIEMVFDGTAFRALNSNVTYTSVNSITAVSGEGVSVDGSSKVNLNYPGLSSNPAIQPTDLLSYYSQGDTHHRVLTYAQLLALIGNGSGAFKGLQVITTTGNTTWSKPAGVNSVLVFATGPGGAGGGASGTRLGSDTGAGGGAGSTAVNYADLTNVSSVAVSIGSGGTGVNGATGNPGSGPTSFGTYAVAQPGGGGHGADIADPDHWGGQGGPVSGGVGMMVLPGGGGGMSGSDHAGAGGDSFWAGGGRGYSPEGPVGIGDRGYFGSGGGGGDNNQGGSTQPGAPGGDGVIVLLMFS